MRRKLVFLGSKNSWKNLFSSTPVDRWASPKRYSEHSPWFLHWIIHSRSSFPPLVISFLEREEKKLGCVQLCDETIPWQSILTLWGSEGYFTLFTLFDIVYNLYYTYCTSDWREGESRNNCLSSFMNCLTSRKEGGEKEKSTNSLSTDKSSFH